MTKILLIIPMMILAFCSHAQFTTEGKIEYERRTNLHRNIDQMDDDQRRTH